MHPSHARAAVDGHAFDIVFQIGNHVEMVNDDGTICLTVTAKEGAMVSSGSSVKDLEGCADSIYATIMLSGLGRTSLGIELLEPDGTLVEPFASNVVPLRKIA